MSKFGTSRKFMKATDKYIRTLIGLVHILLRGTLTGRQLMWTLPVRPRLPVMLGLLIVLPFAGGCGTGPAATASQAGSTEEDLSLYARDIVPLTPEECGQCQKNIYELIRSRGGGHRINCRRCHVRFHMYRPGRVEYEDVLPRCDACHNAPHGAQLLSCLGCHSQVHSPLAIPAGRVLANNCYICHPDLDKELKTFTTRHTELYCSACHHTRHGYIPECRECHQPHTEEMTQADCLVCHMPHKALEVEYPQDTPRETCAICHPNAYEKLLNSGTGHAVLQCTFCHPRKHRTYKRCRECHGEPHDSSIHLDIKVCGRCHGPAHTVIM